MLNIIIIIIYFENVHFFHATLGLDVCPNMKPLQISLKTAHSWCKPSTFISSSTHSYQVFLFLPLHLAPPPPFYRLIPNHPHSYASDAQTTSVCHVSPHPPHSVHPEPEDCTNPHCISYPSATPRTSISPSSIPSSPDSADLLSSSPRFQSHMSVHSGHKPCISFPLCSMKHPEHVEHVLWIVELTNCMLAVGN